MEITKSIIKKFRRKIWSKFVSAVKDYNLIEENDKIAVCISGGKDSFLLALCLDELKRHGQFKFDLVFLCMNPGYKKENLDKIKENASKMGIDINIFESNIFEVVDKSDLSSPCYLCARMRRGCLYNKAKEMGCNKVAYAHHKDDIINYNNLEFIDCACSISKKKNSSKRKYIKDLIKELNLVNRNADINIFRSLENVNIDTLNVYIKNSVKYDFNDLYKVRK